MMRVGFLAVAAMIAASAPALGQNQSTRQWPSQVQRWTPHLPECTCRAQGRDFGMGETICMKTANGDRLAVCGMAQNNTSWNVLDDACTVSALVSPAT